MILRASLITAFILSTALTIRAADAGPAGRFNVRAFGATGDSKTKDTAAVQKALDACAAAGGGEVLVPAGNYLIGSVVIGSNTTVRFEKEAMLTGSPDIEDYPLMDVRWEGEWRQGHRALLFANKADRIAIVGPGSIVGPPLSLGQLRNPRGPVIFEPIECSDLLLDGFSISYQRLWTAHLTYCQNIIARNLKIRTTLGLSNGDGIDLDSCQNALIEHCDIDTGDDAICLKSGRGMEAVRIGRPTQNVVVRDCTLGSSFAGVGIGTEMSGGVRNVRIENCTFTHGQNGIFIKSRDGRGGFMENITGDNLTFSSTTFIGIDLVTKGIQATEPVTGDVEKWARVRNISFSNIKVNDVRVLVDGRNIPAQRPLDTLSIVNVTGTCRRAITLSNVVNARFDGISVTGFTNQLFTLDNVKGTGLENPASASATDAKDSDKK